MKLATMIYLIKGSEILFLERRKENDKVHQQGVHISMGGKVEKGESLENCIIRETFEESGVKVNSVELKGVLYFKNFGDNGEDWTDFLYISNDFKGKPINGNEGNFLWVNKKDINKLNLYEGDKVFFDYLFRYKFFVAEFLYDKFNLVEHKLLKSF